MIPMASTAELSPAPVTAGAVVDGYRIAWPLHGGPRGPSYQAVSLETGRRVSLKLLTRCEPEWRERLEERLAALIELKAPGIVLPVAMNLDATPSPWLAIPWIEGENLGEQLRAEQYATLSDLGRMERLREILEALCRALEPLHLAKLAHGGLAPSKIVAPRAGNQPVMLLDSFFPPASCPADMGDAVIADDALPFVEYLAPEVVIGGNEPDIRSEVWSIGAVCLEALVNVSPWSFERLTLGEARRRMRTTHPLRPQTVDTRVNRRFKYFPPLTMFHLPERRPESALEVRGLLTALLS